MPRVLPLGEIERKKATFAKWIKTKKAAEDVTNGMILGSKAPIGCNCQNCLNV